MRMFVLVVLVMAAPLIAHGFEPPSTSLFSPPPGNSLAITGIALAGKLTYSCEKDSGQWILVQKKAILTDQTNHTKVIGFYIKNYQRHRSPRHAGAWSMINSEGDAAESGHYMSIVSGRKIATMQGNEHDIQDFLAQASLHQHEGIARRISYISQLNMKLLALPPTSKCTAKEMQKVIGFEAKFNFWSQDVAPPEIPSYLSVPPQHQVVESFFAQGNVRFEYDHKNKVWMQQRMLAKLYDVPGGILLGGFSYTLYTAADVVIPSYQQKHKHLACITINNPNGLKVCGTQATTKSSSVHQSSLPWALFRVATNKGNITKTVGPFTFFQMVSTWEGTLPHSSNQSSMITTLNGQRRSFTCIFWLYASKVY